MDFIGFQANFDGSMETVTLLRPVLKSSAPDPLAKIDTASKNVQSTLDTLRADPGYDDSGFVEWLCATDSSDALPEGCANSSAASVTAAQRRSLADLLVRWTVAAESMTKGDMMPGGMSTSTSQATARNLMGFKDGTRNLKVEKPRLVDKWVWADETRNSHWMRGGSYLVARKIQMFIETWDHETLSGREEIFGRSKGSGAPLGAAAEFATPDLNAKNSSNNPIIPDDAHIRHASPSANDGVHLLRRGYNYSDGMNPMTGSFDSGLFFLAFTSDPAHFTRVQGHVAKVDALNEYIKHISNSVFACPRGLDKDQTWRDQHFT